MPLVEKIFDSIGELPQRIKDKIPSNEGLDIFRRVFNKRFKDSGGDEGSSFAIAFTAVRNAGFKDKEGRLVKSYTEITFSQEHELVTKNEELQLVTGWASIIEEDGKTVVDKQGDMISEDELLQAAHRFVSDSREAKVMHKGDEVGEIVESLVFTPDLQKALGINLNKVGWLITMKVDDETWAKVKKGELRAFSIGGKAHRENVNA